MQTQAQKWESQFKQMQMQGGNADRVREQISLRVAPFASRFNNKPQVSGSTLDSNVITDEFHLFSDGSVINSRTGRVVPVNSPTVYETWGPSERAAAFKEVEAGTRRNLGTPEHPLFIEDIKNPEDREAISASHLWDLSLAAAVGM